MSSFIQDILHDDEKPIGPAVRQSQVNARISMPPSVTRASQVHKAAPVTEQNFSSSANDHPTVTQQPLLTPSSTVIAEKIRNDPTFLAGNRYQQLEQQQNENPVAGASSSDNQQKKKKWWGLFGRNEEENIGEGKDGYRSLENSSDGSMSPSAATNGEGVRGGNAVLIRRAQNMFRYSLIFINFTFVVAAMLLIMAGIVARENSAVKLCEHCGELTLVSIIFGILLWLFAMGGFNWVKQKYVFLVMVYGSFLIILIFTLVAVIIAAGVFDAQVQDQANSESSAQFYLEQWQTNVRTNTSSGYSSICDLQQKFNCSGFRYYCCVPCTGNPSRDPSCCYPLINGTIVPANVSSICPACGPSAPPPAPQVCTDIFFAALRKNLGGFLVITCFSLMLVITGILLALLTTRLNRSKIVA